MKPERSLVWIAVLPICAANASARRTVSRWCRGRRRSPRASSPARARRSAGPARGRGGPSTRPVRRSGSTTCSTPRMACSPSSPSRRLNASTLAASSSTIASTTTSRGTSASRSVDHDDALQQRARVVVGQLAALDRPGDRLLDALLGPVQRACSRLAEHDAQPARAADSAMPLPMNPAPKTPTRSISDIIAIYVVARGRRPADLSAVVRRRVRRRRRRPRGRPLASSTISSGSASTRSGCRRSSARRWPTSATTWPTTATSTRCSARSPTSTACSPTRTRAASGC